MKDILIVIDMQNDFIDGALGSAEARSIVPLVCERVARHGGEVYFTRDTHGEDYLGTREGRLLPTEHCIKGTRGWQICDGLLPYASASDGITDKPTFGSTELARRVAAECEGDDATVTLIGVCTDICVISNAMLIKAFMPEAEVRVESRLCAGVTPERHERALLAMEACQISVIR